MSQQAVNVDTNQSLNPIRESQFYTEIKSATEHGHKSQFALLMAMVTKDAMQLDEFHQPRRVDESKLQNLKKQLFIQDKPLIGDLDATRSVAMNKLVQQGYKTSIAFELGLSPEALIDKKEILPWEVWHNLDVNVTRRLGENRVKQAESNPSTAKPNEIDVETWFNVLQESRTLSVAA